MKIPTKTAQILTVMILGLLVGVGAAAQSIHIPSHEKLVLKNGLTVLLLEKHGVPIVSFDAIVKTGAAADPEGQEGLASIAAELDYIGGSFGSDAGADFTSVSAEFLTKDLGPGLDLFSDALLHPTFPQAEADKVLAHEGQSAAGAGRVLRRILVRRAFVRKGGGG